MELPAIYEQHAGVGEPGGKVQTEWLQHHGEGGVVHRKRPLLHFWVSGSSIFSKDFFPTTAPCVKGECQEIFHFRFFPWIIFHQAPDNSCSAIFVLFFLKFAKIFATQGQCYRR